MTEKSEAIRMKITDSCHSIYLPHNCRLMYLKAFSPGQQYMHHWGTCQKCKLLDATSDLLNQILRVGPSNLCFSKCSRWFWWGLRVCESRHLGLRMFLESSLAHQTLVFQHLRNITPSNLPYPNFTSIGSFPSAQKCAAFPPISPISYNSFLHSSAARPQRGSCYSLVPFSPNFL